MTADKDEFVKIAKQFLSTQRSFVDTKKLSLLGLNSGSVTPQEAARLEGHSILPDWLAQGLSDGQARPASSSLPPSVIVKGSHCEASQPILLGESELPPNFVEVSGHSPSVKLYAGTNGTFILQNFMKAAFANREYIQDLTNVRNSWSWPHFSSYEATHLGGRTLVAVVEGSAVLSHWLFDTMPKFELVRLFGCSLRKLDNIVIATSHTKFHQESLTALGVQDSQVYQRRAVGPLISTDEFYAVSDLRSGFFAENWIYDLIIDRFTYGPRVVEPWRRLYISRAKASRRRILNEEQLLPILIDRGFSIIYAEDMSVRNTAQLMQEASHVVAPHGAGLANVAFAHTDTKVLEIFGAHISTEFWKICSTRGISYYLLQASDPEGTAYDDSRLSQMGFFQRNATDMYLDPGRFESCLDAFVN